MNYSDPRNIFIFSISNSQIWDLRAESFLTTFGWYLPPCIRIFFRIRIRIQDAKILQRIWILSTASMYPSFHSSFLHIFSQSYFYLIIHWLISCIIYSPFHLIHFCSYYYILSYFLRDIFILYILTLTWTLS